MKQRLPAVLLTGGAATLAGALVWWILSYWQVWSNDYLSVAESSRCLVANSSICRLATSLCTGQHAAAVVVYSPIALWAGVAMTLASLLPGRQKQAT